MANTDHIEMHNNPVSSKTCRICSSAHGEDHNSSLLGICERCVFKILVVLVIVLVVVSYVMWFSVI
jgi:hypothetical protein